VCAVSHFARRSNTTKAMLGSRNGADQRAVGEVAANEVFLNDLLMRGIEDVNRAAGLICDQEAVAVAADEGILAKPQRERCRNDDLEIKVRRRLMRPPSSWSGCQLRLCATPGWYQKNRDPPATHRVSRPLLVSAKLSAAGG
jgi:hypothetical protein